MSARPDRRRVQTSHTIPDGWLYCGDMGYLGDEGAGAWSIARRDLIAFRGVEVEHRTFSGPYAAQCEKEVLYVTERCVFRLTREGLELVEVAPGIDIERDIVGKMGFAPIVRRPRSMDPRIFRPEPMGLRGDMLRMPFDARFKYDDEANILFINLSDLRVTPEILARLVDKVASIVGPLGHKVYCVANYG
jgi:propionate CoA-transferase